MGHFRAVTANHKGRNFAVVNIIQLVAGSS
ncbi:hypothetical protein QFZ79_002150 [Arthrobacter sp. V4I6]|nr:hypothetical protein [Arthrobacter sp. V1I7]MDQ0854039.1 hypothetical protein [Arthrobacter sp. V4I6]